MWRPVLAQVASLKEIETYYTLVDLLDVNEALDLQQYAEQLASAKAHAEAKRR